MKVLQETSKWPGSTPNHIYALSEKGELIGYVNTLTQEVVLLSHPMPFYKTRRSFVPVANTWNFHEPDTVGDPKPSEAPSPTRGEQPITGSTGSVYILSGPLVGGSNTSFIADRCTCPGFTYRGTCSHLLASLRRVV